MKNSMNLWTQFPFNSKHFWHKADELTEKYSKKYVDDHYIKMVTNYLQTDKITKYNFVVNEDKQWTVTVDLPGIDPETVKVEFGKWHLDVTVDQQVLRIPFDSSKYDGPKLEVGIKFGRLTATAPLLTVNTDTRTIKVKTE